MKPVARCGCSLYARYRNTLYKQMMCAAGFSPSSMDTPNSFGGSSFGVPATTPAAVFTPPPKAVQQEAAVFISATDSLI